MKIHLMITDTAAELPIDDLRREIQEDHEITHNWRNTTEQWGPKLNMVGWISQGYERGPRISKLLGLPQLSNMVAIDGDVLAGSQSISAQQCPCGQWFISNHPRKKK